MTKPRPSARLREAILELGLRYRPSEPDKVTIHEQKLGLLVNDLAGIPIGPLEKAIAAWVKRSHYMPKASELITLAQESIAEPERTTRSTETIDEICQRYNDSAVRTRSFMRWRIVDGKLDYFDVNDLTR